VHKRAQRLGLTFLREKDADWTAARNRRIRAAYVEGITAPALAVLYNLTPSGVYKIVYGKGAS
jgi:hypothetical protein